MVSYLRVTPSRQVRVTRRFRFAPAVMLVLICVAAACGGSRRPPAGGSPQKPNHPPSPIMDAGKANDLTRMGNLWGSQKGPASTYMNGDRLKRTLQTIHVYWDHRGYRVIEGPMAAQPLNPTFKDVPSMDRLRDFRVEVQRANGCVAVMPITLVLTDQGTWLVYDVHLESAGNPAQSCQPSTGGGQGTKP